MVNNQTIVRDSSSTFLVLRAIAVRDDAEAPGATAWRAEVDDAASPLAGLYAFGESFAEVRDSLASFAWAAIVAGELAEFGITTSDLAGVHLVVTTSATYDAEELSAAVSSPTGPGAAIGGAVGGIIGGIGGAFGGQWLASNSYEWGVEVVS